jgi:outer membrane protein OmpA-like peptidoglycan-associated protein
MERDDMTGRLVKMLLVTAAVAALTGVAHAYEGPYVRGDIGYSTDTNFSADDENIDWGDVSADEGWMGLLGGGYSWLNGFRLEGELGYRDNDFNDTEALDDGGSITAWSLMANGYYDFNAWGMVRPYVGLGIGVADVEVEGADLIPAPPAFADGSETAFAWQAIIGLGWAVSEQVTIDFGYRYFNVEGIEFDVTVDDVVFEAEGDVEQQAVTVGLRYSFAPPPPMAPMPPPPPPREPQPEAATCPQSNFTVYFEWDRSNLNQAAEDTLDAAMQRARECNIAAALVVGHTDTSGSHEHNQALSERRASVVRDALVRRGMSSSVITTEARGETDLARQTPDGVREPLNRRTAVTITFR